MRERERESLLGQEEEYLRPESNTHAPNCTIQGTLLPIDFGQEDPSPPTQWSAVVRERKPVLLYYRPRAIHIPGCILEQYIHTHALQGTTQCTP